MIKVTMRDGQRVTLDLRGDVARIEVGDTVLTFDRVPPEKPRDVDLGMLVAGAPLSVRALNCMDNAGIKTLGDLLQRRESDLLRTRNFGRRSVGEVVAWLATMGLALQPIPRAGA